MKKVLVIDDEPQILTLMQRRIESEGYDVITAQDGKDGLEKAQQESPNLILLDIMMPEMDGYDTLAQLKGAYATQKIPVIMFSAQGGQESQRKSEELGADQFLEKPIIPEDLREKMKALLSVS